jgi:hypothetical protein
MEWRKKGAECNALVTRQALKEDNLEDQKEYIKVLAHACDIGNPTLSV